MNFTTITLGKLAVTSLLVSGIIIVFLPLRPLLRRAIGSQWVCILWVALLARLLMPWQVESRWGVFHRQQDRSIPVVAVAQEPVKIKVSFPKDGNLNDNSAGIPATAPGTQAGAVAVTHWDFRDIDFWNAAWMGGALFGLAILGWRWMQTLRLGAKTRPAADGRLRDIFEAIPKELRRNTRLRMTDAIHVPTLAGVLRPQIWMPESWPAQFTDKELRNVLLHELGHARRGDLIVQWLFAFAQCIHWFNPLVWMAARVARLDREMACDAWVLARNGADHAGYGAALMKTVQLLRPPVHAAPATVAMASSRRSLFARVSGIGAFRPMPAWRGVTGIAVMIMALAAATTSRTPAQESAQKSAAPAASGAVSRQWVGVKSTIVIIREETWKKLCAENPDFRDFAGAFPEMEKKNPPVADIVKGLKNRSGPWEVPGEIKLLKSLSGEQEAKMTADLDNLKDALLFESSPSLTTRTGRRAMIEEVTEFRYPSAFVPNTKARTGIIPTAWETRNLGATIEAMPVANNNGAIEVQLAATFTGYLGILQENEGVRKFLRMYDEDFHGSFAKPVFSISTGNVILNIPPSQTALLGGVRVDNHTTDDVDNPAGAPAGDKMGKMTGLNEWAGKGPPSPETVRNVILVFARADVAPPPAGAESPAAADRYINTIHPATEGKVLAVHSEGDAPFAVISFGAMEGAAPDAEGLARRDGRLIARLKIKTIEPDSSVAEIIPGSVAQGESVKIGDKVIFAWQETVPTTVEEVAPSASPAATPESPAPTDSGPGAGNGSERIALESKFVEITEEGWRKLCDANPMFKDYNSKLPGLAQEKIAYADLKGKLLQGEKASWEIPEGRINQLAVLSKEEFEKMIGAFNQAKEVDLLSTPSVKTKDNQNAEIEAIVEFRYGSEWEESDKPETVTSNGGVTRTLQPPIFTPTAFATRNTGVTLEARPKINEEGSIELNLAPSLVGFIGFLSEKEGVKSLGLQYPSPTGGTHPGQPVFSTSTGRITTTVQSGQTVLMGAVRLDMKNDSKPWPRSGPPTTEPAEEHAAESQETVHNVLLVFVTAKIVKQDERAEASASPAAASTAESRDPKIPDGIPVPGKEGFVTSPYSPDSGMIDVRGYEKGTEVKDPYSGKIFLVP